LPDEIQARRFAQMIANQLSQQLALESTLIKTSTVRDTVELWLASVPVRNPLYSSSRLVTLGILSRR
jgi:hypothetical protein